MNILVSHMIAAGALLRIGFFFFGLYQDEYMPVKYTDIDYLVFSDAANYVHSGKSPYLRETYRYTPLLAWILVPNSWGPVWYHFGKLVFVASDLVTGLIITSLLRKNKRLSEKTTLVLSSIWLLNPMVITISTRGSSESVLTVIIMLAVYFLEAGKVVSAGFWLGLAVHFKIYPIIYLPTAMLYLLNKGSPYVNIPILKWINWKNLQLLLASISTLALFNGIMYAIYGYEFLYHSYFYHLTRVDHRHNFSVYNVALYYKSAITESSISTGLISIVSDVERIAFVPQLALSGVVLPLLFAREDLAGSLFLQTFAFVIFNKVMTSQYFIWFLIFLPHFLAGSRLLTQKYAVRGLFTLALWVVSQATWLYFAFSLEFLGRSTFDNGLLYSSVFFFFANCWILGEFITDLGTRKD